MENEKRQGINDFSSLFMVINDRNKPNYYVHDSWFTFKPVLLNCKLRPTIPARALFRLGLRKFFVNGCQRQENPDS